MEGACEFAVVLVGLEIDDKACGPLEIVSQFFVFLFADFGAAVVKIPGIALQEGVQ